MRCGDSQGAARALLAAAPILGDPVLESAIEILRENGAPLTAASKLQDLSANCIQSHDYAGCVAALRAVEKIYAKQQSAAYQSMQDNVRLLIVVARLAAGDAPSLVRDEEVERMNFASERTAAEALVAGEKSSIQPEAIRRVLGAEFMAAARGYLAQDDEDDIV